MDVLKPQLIWIGKRCYRVNSNASDNNMEQPITNEYIEDGLHFLYFFSIQKTSKLDIFVSMHINSSQF